MEGLRSPEALAPPTKPNKFHLGFAEETHLPQAYEGRARLQEANGEESSHTRDRRLSPETVLDPSQPFVNSVQHLKAQMFISKRHRQTRIFQILPFLGLRGVGKGEDLLWV